MGPLAMSKGSFDCHDWGSMVLASSKFSYKDVVPYATVCKLKTPIVARFRNPILEHDLGPRSNIGPHNLSAFGKYFLLYNMKERSTSQVFVRIKKYM
jgi:hypothetical protein